MRESGIIGKTCSAQENIEATGQMEISTQGASVVFQHNILIEMDTL